MDYGIEREVFIVAEVVELGLLTARFLGSHRWMHVLDVLSTEPPILTYHPQQVNARFDEVASATN